MSQTEQEACPTEEREGNSKPHPGKAQRGVGSAEGLTSQWDEHCPGAEISRASQRPVLPAGARGSGPAESLFKERVRPFLQCVVPGEASTGRSPAERPACSSHCPQLGASQKQVSDGQQRC